MSRNDAGRAAVCGKRGVWFGDLAGQAVSVKREFPTINRKTTSFSRTIPLVAVRVVISLVADTRLEERLRRNCPPSYPDVGIPQDQLGLIERRWQEPSSVFVALLSDSIAFLLDLFETEKLPIMALWYIEHDFISISWRSFCDDQHSQIMLRWRFLALEFPFAQPIFDLSLATMEVLPK